MAQSLLLVDDHPLFRDGFAQMLRERRPGWALHLAGSAAEARAALDGGLAADLMIVDIQLPDGDGVAAASAIAADHPTVPRVMISGRDDPATLHRVRRSGASGFIAKAAEVDATLAALEAVLAGELAFDPAADGAAPPSLTERQAEVLELLCEGHGNKEIRYRLGIAERTVRAHMTELFQLLGVNSRVQAILRARQLGLAD